MNRRDFLRYATITPLAVPALCKGFAMTPLTGEQDKHAADAVTLFVAGDVMTRFEPFYRFYRKKLMFDAVKFAKKRGFEVITCGHTHFPEDRTVRGVRYINTGAWTEYPPHYLVVSDREIRLKRYAPF